MKVENLESRVDCTGEAIGGKKSVSREDRATVRDPYGRKETRQFPPIAGGNGEMRISKVPPSATFREVDGHVGSLGKQRASCITKSESSVATVERPPRFFGLKT